MPLGGICFFNFFALIIKHESHFDHHIFVCGLAFNRHAGHGLLCDGPYGHGYVDVYGSRNISAALS